MTNTQSKINSLEELNSKFKAENIKVRQGLKTRIEVLEKYWIDIATERADLKARIVELEHGVMLNIDPFLEWVRARCLLSKISNCIEGVVNRDRLKRCICQDNGIFLIEVWYFEKPEIVIPERIQKTKEFTNQLTKSLDNSVSKL
ncbi:hypothetical protein Glove_401g12 [Diversispora epigaea]|uniref:Uncharacterized protein n=1 Tax=Diversispora epigaea TaxID=1348612 RepID=A0A397H0K9_9GLOM|nr:hypothetical protein Glove_401g12 [Diversispora epigaea]